MTPAAPGQPPDFDYFAIGVPDKEAIDQLAARLNTLGELHAGVGFPS